MRLDVGRHEWGADLAEFIATGTAIRHSEGQIHRAPNGRPFGFIQATAQTGRNVEMANYTQALYEARELAMARMQDEAEQSQAQGIVGVQIQETNHGWGSHTIEFFAIGTAVIPVRDPVGIPTPTPVISLDN